MLKLVARILGALSLAAIIFHPLLLSSHLGSCHGDGTARSFLLSCPCESHAESHEHGGHDSKGCPLCKILASLASETRSFQALPPDGKELVPCETPCEAPEAERFATFSFASDVAPRAPPLS